jgi:pimeloyl-ACP methyl ester carboxylesterase
MKAVFYPTAQALLCYNYFCGAKPTHVYLAGLGTGATGIYPSVLFGSELASYHTLMPDFLGFGYSDRPNDFGYTIEEHADSIAYLLDQLQATGCTVIGYSLGGTVAITLAMKRPDLVTRLVLLEAPLDPMDLVGAGQSEQQYIASGHSIVLEQVRQITFSIDLSNRGWFPMFKLAAPHAFYRTAVSLATGMQPNWREQLYELKIPSLYIWSEKNFREEYTETFTTHGVQVAVIPHAGHHDMVWENPAAFVRAIVDFEVN